MIDKESIIKYADCLLIGLSDEEVEMLEGEFEAIKDNMDIIASFDGIKNVQPLSYPRDLKTKVLREDDAVRSISSTEALLNAPDKMEDVVIVPKVVG